MAETSQRAEAENTRLILGLLESVERDARQSQRRLATELGVAVGLVNAYMHRAINKGLVKVREAPARRYAYYLTPKGFAEKSRLTVKYLSYSFSLLRTARSGYAEIFNEVSACGIRRVVFAGASELAEIAILCAIECEIEVVSIVDPNFKRERFVGRPVVASFDGLHDKFEIAIITDLQRAAEAYASAVKACGRDHVIAPALLGIRIANVGSRG